MPTFYGVVNTARLGYDSFTSGHVSLYSDVTAEMKRQGLSIHLCTEPFKKRRWIFTNEMNTLSRRNFESRDNAKKNEAE